MTQKLVLGLDFGGTKLAAGVIDLASSWMVDSAQTNTPARTGAPGAAAAMIALAGRLKDVDKIEGIGVSFDGPVRKGQIIRSLHVEGWPGFPLRERLRERFGPCEVRIANDANVIALGQWKFGAGRGADSLLYLTVSTGIGGGIVTDGRLWEGSSGVAGEVGHLTIVPGGPPCSCGRRGCLEAVAAGPAIVKSALKALEKADMPSAMRDRYPLTAKDIAELAHQGDDLAAWVLRQAATYLGLGIANAVNLLDVERVVVGGGVSRAGPIWWETVQEAAHADLLPWCQGLDMRLSELTGQEGLWGAAALLAEG